MHGRLLRDIGLVGLAASGLSCARAARTVNQGYMAVVSQLAPDRVRLDLDEGFVERYRNRVTITADFTVDAVSRTVNPNAFDGDLHFAGRAPTIGLRLVAEIKNADTEDSAQALVRAARTAGRPLLLTGAWRVWPEHALGAPETQGDSVPALRNANPDHLFEIHPVTRIAGLGLLRSLHPVSGYRPGSPRSTLEEFTRARISIQAGDGRIRLTLPTGLYNDVHFILAPGRHGHRVVVDGRFLTGTAHDLDGNLLVEGLRIVLVRGSAAERAIRRLGPGGRARVWALPRVSFAELSRIARTLPRDSTHAAPLPFELLILGVYPPDGVD